MWCQCSGASGKGCWGAGGGECATVASVYLSQLESSSVVSTSATTGRGSRVRSSSGEEYPGVRGTSNPSSSSRVGVCTTGGAGERASGLGDRRRCRSKASAGREGGALVMVAEGLGRPVVARGSGDGAVNVDSEECLV